MIAGASSGVFSASNTWAYGSGGRMAFYANTSTYMGKKQASAQPGYNAGAGTIYNKLSSQENGDLVIDAIGGDTTTGLTPEISESPVTYDNIQITGGAHYSVPSSKEVRITTNVVAGGGSSAAQRGHVNLNGNLRTLNPVTWTNYYLYMNGNYQPEGDLTIGNGSTFEVMNTNPTTSWQITPNVTVANGGNITHSANSTTEASTLNLAIGGNFNVSTGGMIDTNAKGYIGGAGPGKGTSNFTGGGYGGTGASSGANPGGTTYGSATEPTNIGSGGSSSTNGASGGGSVKIQSAKDVVVNGTIRADGGGSGYGSGSGGSVWLLGKAIMGNGTVSAKGGYYNSNGPGGGGRIAFSYTNNFNIAAITPSQGTSGDQVTITGSGLSPSAVIKFGKSIASYTYIDNTKIIATAPARNIPGPVDVTVSQPTFTGTISVAAGGTGAQDGTTSPNPITQIATVFNGFTYVSSPPVVLTVSPRTGPTTGGTRVKVSGSNFYLPNQPGSNWYDTGKTTGFGNEGGEVVIIQDKIYLFGGSGSNRIHVANLSDPTTWTNTGKTLPGGTRYSHIEIIGQTIYLFSNNNGAIYTASISDPTTWTNTGSTMSVAGEGFVIQKIGNTLYRYGGSTSSKSIKSASVNNPLSWTDVGNGILPYDINHAQSIVIGDKIWFFGGYSTGSADSAIYYAPTSNPTALVKSSKNLPSTRNYISMFVIGEKMYLAGSYTGGSGNAIYSANINDPENWTNTGTTLPANRYGYTVALIQDAAYLFEGYNSSGSIYKMDLTRTTDNNAYQPAWQTDWNTTAPNQAYIGVDFGGVPATNVTVVDSNTLYANTAPRTASTVDTTVTNTDSRSATKSQSFRYVVPAEIDSIIPSYGSMSGGDQVMITGSNFVSSMEVSIGGIPAATQFISSNQIIATTPAHPIGVVDISVTEPDVLPVTKPNSFSYVGAPPVVTNISPRAGPYSGGTQVSISGEGIFNDYSRTLSVNNSSSSELKDYPIRVSINTAALIAAKKMRPDCGDIRFKSLNGFTTYPYWVESGCNSTTTSVWLKLPSLVVGNNQINLSYGDLSRTSHSSGSDVFAFFDGFDSKDPTKWDYAAASGWSVNTENSQAISTNYFETLKTITQLNLPIVDTNGGYAVGISATNTSSIAPRDIVLSSTINSITYETPRATDSTSYYRLFDRSCEGSSTCPSFATNTANKYETTVASGSQKGYLNNSTTPYDTRTGTAVFGTVNDFRLSFRSSGSVDYIYARPFIKTEPTITLDTTEQTQAPVVKFDGLLATAISYDPLTSVLRATTPAHTVGEVDVAIEINGHMPLIVPRSFLYTVPPTLESITPIEGPSEGGTSVTLTGANFSSSAEVYFGDVKLDQVTVIDSHTIVAITPAHLPGEVTVAVVNQPDGTRTTTQLAYTFLRPAPTVISVTPDRGTTYGGDTVTITGAGFDKSYLMPITVTNPNPAVDNYQLKLTINTSALVASGKLQADCDDLRITSSNKISQLPYWIESGCNSAVTTVWAKTPLLESGNSTYYVSYGNPSLESKQDRSNVFPLYDDFSTKDDSQWNYTAEWSVSNGFVTSASTAPNSWQTLTSKPLGLTVTAQAGYQLRGKMLNVGTVVPYNVATRVDIDGTTYEAPHLSTQSGVGGLFGYQCSITPTCETVSTHWWPVYTTSILNGSQKTIGTVNYQASTSFTNGVLNNVQLAGKPNGSFDYLYMTRYVPVAPTTTISAEIANFPTVTFGGLPANVTDFTAGSLKVTTPPHAHGPIEVTVANPGSSAGKLADAFTYYPKTLVFTSASPLEIRETEPTPITFELRDDAGNPVSYTSDTEVMLNSSTTSGFFARDLQDPEETRWDYNSVIVPAGQSSATFYYKNTIKGAYYITATAPLANGNIDTRLDIDVSSRYRLLVTGVTNPVKAGIPSSVTVQAIDYNDVALHDYNGKIHFTSSDGGAVLPSDHQFTNQMMGGKTFTNGVTLVTQGTWCVTATDMADPDISGSQCGISVDAPAQGSISKLKFITNPPLFAANSQSDTITVQTQDSTGTPIPVGADTTIYLYSDSETGEFSVNGTTWIKSGSTITIKAGTTSGSFFYRDSSLGTPTLTARDDAGTGADYYLQNAVTQAVVGGGVAHHFGITKPTDPIIANFPSQPFRITAYDSLGNEALITQNLSVWITTDSPTGLLSSSGNFDTDGSIRLPVTIVAGQTGADFYFKDTKAGLKNIFASDAEPRNGDIGILDDSEEVSVNGGPYAAIGFATAPKQIVAGGTSDVITVELRDALGNRTVASSDTTIYLSLEKTGGILQSPTTTTPITKVVIKAGQSTADFRLKQTTYTPFQTIVASDNQAGPDGDEGIDDSSQAAVIVGGGNSKLAFSSSSPTTGVVGTMNGPYSVGITNQNNINVPADGDTPLLLSSSSPSGEFSLDGDVWSQTISTTLLQDNMNITFYYRDTASGSINIKVSDQSGNQDINLVDASRQISISVGNPTKLAYTTTPQTLQAGQTSNQISLQLTDDNGNRVITTSSRQITITTTSPTGRLDGNSNGTFTSDTLTLTINPGQQSVSFYYRDLTVGTPTLTANSTNLTSAEQQETINWGDAAAIKISGQDSIDAGSISSPLTLSVLNAFNVVIPAPAGVVTTLTSTHGTTGKFDIAANSGFLSSSLQITIPKDSLGVDFYYKDTAAGSSLIQAQSGSLNGTKNITVNAGAPSQIALRSVSQTLMRNQPSNPILVELRDQYGNPTKSLADVTLMLSSTSANSSFMDTNSTPITSTIIKSNETTASFIYVDRIASNPVVTIASPLNTLNQTQTIINGSPAGLSLTATDGSALTAGDTKEMRLSLVNQYGAIVAATSDTDITVKTSSSSGRFDYTSYDSFTNSQLVVTISAGSSDSVFYYKDTTAGSPTVSATRQGYNSGSYSFNINGSSPHSLRIISNPKTTTAGNTSEPIIIGLVDIYGNATLTQNPITISLASSEQSAKLSDSTTVGNSNPATLTIKAGTSTTEGYYVDTVAGSKTLTASHPGLQTATQPTTVTATDFDHIGFMSAPQTIIVKNPSGSYRVSGYDKFNNPRPLVAMVLSLSSASTEGSFSRSADTWAPISSLAISGGTNEAVFYYKDSRLANTVLTVASSTTATISQPVTVVAGSATGLDFVSSPQTVTTNTPSLPIEISLVDNNGYPSPASTLTNVQLSASSSGQFSLNGTDGWNQTVTLSYQPGDTKLSVFFRDPSDGTVILFANSPGLSSDSQTIVISPGSIAKLGIVSPNTTQANIAIPVTVQTLTIDNRPAASQVATVVALTSTTGGQYSLSNQNWQPISSVTIPAGQYQTTVYYRNTTAGTDTLRATPPQSSSWTSAATEVEIGAGGLARFALAAKPIAIDAGATSSEFIVQAQDAYGNNIILSADQSIHLYGSNNGSFAANPSGPWNIDSITITAGTGTVGFYYTDTMPGSANIIASDSRPLDVIDTGIINAATAVAVNSLPPTQLGFISPERTTTAGEMSEAITIEARQANGDRAIVGEPFEILLRSSQASGQFYSSPTSQTPITSVTLPIGGSTATLYYRDTKAGNHNLTAYANGVTDAVQSTTIVAAPATKLAFASSTQTKQASEISDQIHIQLQDQYNNKATLPEATTVTLNTATSTGQFSQNITPWNQITSFEISANSSDAYLYYRDTTSGFHTLSAAADGLMSAAQKIRIASGVATSIQITTPAQTLEAGQQSSYITATLLDQYGNATFATQDQLLYVWSTSPKGVFSEKADFSIATTRPVIAQGTSSLNIYYKDTNTGTPTLTIADIARPDNPDLGIANATQTLNIISGQPHHLAIESATNVIAGQTTTVQISTRNRYNVPVAASTDTALFLNSGNGQFSPNQSMTPIVQNVTLPAGQSTMTLVFQSKTAGSTTIGVRDNEQVSADIRLPDATFPLTILPDNLVKLHYLSSPQTREAGEISTPLSVQAEDQYGNAILVPDNITVHLSSASPTMRFSATNDFTANTSTVTIVAGTSLARAYFRDTTVGTPTIIASDAQAPDNPDSGLINDSQTETIIGGTVDRLGWGNVPSQLDMGQISGPIQVQTQNRWGVAIPAPQTTTAYLSHSDASDSFALSTIGPWNLKQVEIPAGQSSATVYFRSNLTGSDTLLATDSNPVADPDSGLKDGRAVITSQPGTPTHLAITTAAQNITARHPSTAYTVQVRNQHGAPVAVNQLTQIYLRSSSNTGEFASQPQGPWGQNYLEIPAGSSSLSFFYHDYTLGTQAITASDNLPINPDTKLQNASQTATITKQVVDHLFVTNISTPQTQGSPSSVVVEAQDNMNYTVSDYAGTITFKSSDSDAVLPTAYQFNPSVDKGIHTFGNAVSFLRSGIKSVTATDGAGITGTQTNIVVNESSAGPIAKLRFIGEQPLYLASGKVSQAITIQSVDIENSPSNAPERGFAIRLSSDSPDGEYSLTPNGPWRSSIEALIPGHLNSTSVYYRDYKVGSSTLKASDWQTGTDETYIENAQLFAEVTGLNVQLTQALEVNNNAHFYSPSKDIYPRSDDGLYRARNTFTIRVRDQSSGNPTPADLVMNLYNPDGTIYQSQTLSNVSDTTYTVDPIIGSSIRGTYRFDVVATSTTNGLKGGAFEKFDISGWSVKVNYNPANNQVGDKLPFTISARFNGAPADPTSFSVNFRDNNGGNVASSPIKTLGDTTRTGVGEYSGLLETDTLLPTDDQFNNAYSVYVKLFDATSNQILAEDNHNDIFFLNNPALSPKNFTIEKILTSTPPAEETFRLKFSWQASQYATSYNLYRTQNRFAQLFSDPCSLQQIKEKHRLGDIGAIEPFCETQVNQTVGTDDTMQWVKMGETNSPSTEIMVEWDQIQSDLPNSAYYYVVRAENARGESGYSTMAITKRHDFTFNDGDMSSINWIALPSVTTLTKPSDLVRDIEGSIGTGSNKVISNVGIWEPETQSAQNYSYKTNLRRWTGVDDPLTSGYGLTLTLSGQTSPKKWTIVGTDKPLTHELKYNPDISNLNWVSLPYSNKYAKLSDVVRDIEGGLGTGNNKIIDNIGVWTPGSQVSLNFSYKNNLRRWTGTDSAILPGDGVVLSLSTNSSGLNWSIPLIIKPNK